MKYRNNSDTPKEIATLPREFPRGEIGPPDLCDEVTAGTNALADAPWRRGIVARAVLHAVKPALQWGLRRIGVVQHAPELVRREQAVEWVAHEREQRRHAPISGPRTPLRR